MTLYYPNNTIWFVQAETGAERSEGSAVAIRLREIGKASTAATYLLTCVHVIRGKSADGEDGCGPVAARIRAWPPDRGFNDQEAKEVKPFLPELPAGEVPKEQRANAAEDWVILKIADPQSVSAADTVAPWLAATASGYVRIYGYPGGSELVKQNHSIVTPRAWDTFPVQDGSDGTFRLTGDGARPGHSGGGVFTTPPVRFAGIHRSRYDAVLEIRAVSCLHIQQRLYELGYEIVESGEEEWFNSYAAGLRELLENDRSFKKHDVDFEYLLKPSDSGPKIGADVLCDMVVHHQIRGALIYGKGGSGKSAYLGRIARRLLDRYGDEFCPLIISGGKLDSVRLDSYLRTAAADGSLEDLEDILGHSPLVRYQDYKPISEIRTLIGGRRLFFLIDGINEVRLAARDDGLFVEMTRRIGVKPQDGCIVTARSRLAGVSTFWKSFEVDVVGNKFLGSFLLDTFQTSLRDLQQHQEKVVEILRNPFFLQLAINASSLEFKNRANLLYDHFRKERQDRGIGIPDDDLLERVGGAALQMYVEHQSTWFPVTEMQQLLGQDPVKLLEGDLDVQGKQARFSHQLKHDFLVSYYLFRAGTENPKVWQRENFDGATFHTENRDPLILAVEQLQRGDHDHNDIFLRSVYDWHLGAAFSCLIADEPDPSGRPPRFSVELRKAMLALFADKRDDPMRHTKKDYDEWALRITASDDKDFFDSSRKVRDIVLTLPSGNPWFETWRSIFVGDRAALKKHIDKIAGDDQVLAWTIANAIRRPGIGKPEDAGYLSGMLQELARTTGNDPDPNAISRWRIVHALSAFGGAEYAAEAVRDRLDNEKEYIWVRYGAGRSLVEMAALQVGPRRQELLDWLAHSTAALVAAVQKVPSPQDREILLRILREIGRSVLYQGVAEPKSWVESVALLVQMVSLQIQNDLRYGQRWRDNVLIPFRSGDWIGEKPSDTMVEQMRQHGVSWPDT